jgi:NAD(P)-dependent dehydrogenase (short-subunit alcohol dehydrogenase family)
MDHVIVIIGVGGMGEAIARRLGAGKTVLLADLDASALQRAAEAMSNDGFHIEIGQVDVTDRSAVGALADRASQFGHVVQVAHTAGLSTAPVEAVLRVDLLGAAHSVEEFARVIAPGGAGLVIASMAGAMSADSMPEDVQRALIETPTSELLALPFLQPGNLPDPGAAYAIAKRANQLRMYAASREWGKRGARINSISPGIIATRMGQEELRGEHGPMMREMTANSGMARLGTPTDIAAAAAFLLGPDASFITGTDLLVDGGVVAGLRERPSSVPTDVAVPA